MVVLVPPNVWIDMGTGGGGGTTGTSGQVWGGGGGTCGPTSNFGNIQVISTPSFFTNTTCTTGGAGGDTFWWTGTGTGTCATNTIYIPNIIIVPTDVEYVLDEEEYLNNQVYWDLARQRGVRFRIRTEHERAAAAAEAQRQAEALERRRAAEREQAERDRQAREQAETVAFQLLLEFLTPEQKADMERHGYFYVRGGSSGTRYRINTRGGYQHNIDVMREDEDRRVADLCAHCKGELPKYDHFLAQKFNLEIEEDKFLRIANRRAA